MSTENERLKIQASFWNGLAIAAGAGGIILPLLQAYSNDQLWSAQVFPHFSKLAYTTLLPMAAGLFFAWIFHGMAKSFADRMTND
ncbi:hypothetical protein CT676_00875 [Bradyrhizobium sp. MOS001]|uniref:hypothetical protein n=1 Tax=Bradyrhizobium sp. MOS001 TaxID=2133948 RepID=UPI0010753E22|nr:hypothetical protein [Bradyrhizobium sp. MOS001]TFW62709.1 hypothetical protein CT676_00875 [Bradyrhizobium sp. MOS001]